MTKVEGEIAEVRLGNPHGQLKLDVDGVSSTIEVGQPWRNERAGLTDAKLSMGSRFTTIIGNPSAREGERLIRAVRTVIDGVNHDLYPERIDD